MSFSLSCPRELALLKGLTGGKLSLRFFSLTLSGLITRSRSKMGNAVLAAWDSASKLIFQCFKLLNDRQFTQCSSTQNTLQRFKTALDSLCTSSEELLFSFLYAKYLSYLIRKFLFVARALLKATEE